AVSPLLIFYGVASLAKAIVVARHESLGLHNMRPHHGLSCSGLPHNRVSLRHFTEFKAMVHLGGTFLEYAEALSHVAIYKVFDETTARPATLKITTTPADARPAAEFRLGDVLARQPAVRSVYHHATGE